MAQPTLKEVLQGIPQAAQTLKALGKNTLKDMLPKKKKKPAK